MSDELRMSVEQGSDNLRENFFSIKKVTFFRFSFCKSAKLNKFVKKFATATIFSNKIHVLAVLIVLVVPQNLGMV
jgi:hypothetical protein